MPYATRTLQSLVSEISALANDPTNTFWSVSEVTNAITEFLRVWQLGVGYWVERGVFNRTSPLLTNPPTYWIALQTVLPTLRPRTITYTQIVSEIQAHLIEGQGTSGLAATMSDQFTVLDILKALIRARNRLAVDSMLLYSNLTNIPTDPSEGGRVQLPDSVVVVKRVSWAEPYPTSSTPYLPRTLTRTDPYQADWYGAISSPSTPNPPYPNSYHQTDSYPKVLQLDPPPTNPGQLDIVGVLVSEPDPTAIITSTTIDIPNDLAPVLKYAAMADLLAMGIDSTLPPLANYCESRYKGLLALAIQSRCVLRGTINGVGVSVVTPTTLDNFSPYWMGRGVSSAPTCIASYPDLIAISPVGSGSVSVSLDVFRSAPIPPTGSDYIQLSSELFSALVDYSQHYLSIKVNPEPTAPLLDSVFEAMSSYNARLSAQNRNYTLTGQSGFDEQFTPTFKR